LVSDRSAGARVVLETSPLAQAEGSNEEMTRAASPDVGPLRAPSHQDKHATVWAIREEACPAHHSPVLWRLRRREEVWLSARRLGSGSGSRSSAACGLGSWSGVVSAVRLIGWSFVERRPARVGGLAPAGRPILAGTAVVGVSGVIRRDEGPFPRPFDEGVAAAGFQVVVELT
jgi:hypothetical protein